MKHVDGRHGCTGGWDQSAAITCVISIVLPLLGVYGTVVAMSGITALIGSVLLALSVIALHSVATPTASGACARADIHHGASDTTPVGEVSHSTKTDVDANAAYVSRDQVPVRSASAVHYERGNAQACGLTAQSGMDPPTPELSKLSRWRT